MNKFDLLFQTNKSQLSLASIHVVKAADAEVINALKLVQESYAIKTVLYDDISKLQSLVASAGLEAELVACNSDEEALKSALMAVREDPRAVLMKGLINTSDFLRGVLNRDYGLRTERLLSLMAVYDLPDYHKLLFTSDSGFNVAPNVEDKKMILANAYHAIERLFPEKMKIAFLTANEQVNEKIVSTTDARALVKYAQDNKFRAIAEGPISFDIAFSPEAAKHKGVDSAISGDVDLIIFPNMDAGNVLGKSWLHFNKASWAGTILGAKRPIILGSRSDTAAIKVNSILLSLMI